MTPVTDPAIVQQLETPTAAPAGAKPVTDPETVKALEAAPADNTGAIVARQAGALGRKAAAATADTLKQMDKDVDYSGVTGAGLRAEYGFMDTPEEKQAYLKKHFGDENVSQDSFGRDVVTINGQKVAFLPRGGKETGKKGSAAASWADVASDVAPVAGMTAGGLIGAAAGVGPGSVPLAVGGAAAGGATGKAANKLFKQTLGMNLQSAGETSRDILVEGAKGAGAQATGEVLGLVGRSIFRGPFREGSIFGPLSGKSKEAFRTAQAGVSEARELGLKPKVGSYSPNASFTQRVQNAGFRLFGDDLALKNRPILEAGAEKLTGGGMANAPAQTEALNRGITARAVDLVRTANAAADQATAEASALLKASEEAISGKVGPVSGNLSAALAQNIRAARDAFADKAAALYAPLDAMAGKPVVPTAGLKAAMQQILSEGPQTKGGQPVFASDTIKKFAGDIAQLPDHISFQQMQVARSTLRDRSAIEALNAGLSEHQAARLAKAADMAFDEAAKMETSGAVNSVERQAMRNRLQELEGKAGSEAEIAALKGKLNARPLSQTGNQFAGSAKAAKALRRADKFYAAGIQRFNDLTVEAMVKDATRTGFVEPEKVAERLAVPGMNDKLLRVQRVVTPETFGQIGAVRWKGLLDEAKSPLTGEVDGRRLAASLKKMGPVLKTLYGEGEAARMVDYAEQLAALNGQADAAALASGRMADAVKDAVLKKEAANEVMKRGFVKMLQTDGPESLTGAQWLTEPDHRLMLRQALEGFGPQSQEAKQIREYLARRIFSSMEQPATKGAEKYGTTELMGEPLQKELNRYGRPYLEEVFGKPWTDAAFKFARQAEIATRKNPVDSGGLVAASIGLHWLRHLGEIARYFTAGELLSTDPVITYLSKGIEGEGIDFLQKWVGRGMQLGINIEAEEAPKRPAANARGIAVHTQRLLNRQNIGAMQGVRG